MAEDAIKAIATIDEREVWARIGEVLDPELDRSLDTLGFVDQVTISGGEVSVRLRLPTRQI